MSTSVLPPVERDGYFRACDRCKVTSDDDDAYLSFSLMRRCSLAGRVWLCNYCRDAHRSGCPVCKAAMAR